MTNASTKSNSKNLNVSYVSNVSLIIKEAQSTKFVLKYTCLIKYLSSKQTNLKREAQVEQEDQSQKMYSLQY